MRKNSNSNTIFDLTNKNYIAEIGQCFKDIEKNYPIAFKFLEDFCGFNTPILSSDPQEISYSGGKRDVILTIKTLMRNDITPEQIAQFYKTNL